MVKLLRLFSILLELLDKNQLVEDHVYDDKGEDHLRYMYYGARTPEENEKIRGLYTPGHTDLGNITLLLRQPVAALRILNNGGDWKWVKSQDATITINTCDALTALTSDYIKSSVHRVHTPPAHHRSTRSLVLCTVSLHLVYNLLQLDLTFHKT